MLRGGGEVGVMVEGGTEAVLTWSCSAICHGVISRQRLAGGTAGQAGAVLSRVDSAPPCRHCLRQHRDCTGPGHDIGDCVT